MMKSKKVNEFKIGDKIRLYGYDGMVLEVADDICDGVGCTYLKVKFNNGCEIAGTPYDCGWYGGANNFVSYGGFA